MVERLDTDVTVIGGGAGCAAALALRQRGLRVVLLEKGFCGAGATGVNFGGVRQQGRHLAELPIALRARDIWARLATLVGDDCEYRATGHIKLARSDEDMAELEAYAHDAAACGLELQMIGRNRIRSEYPWLGDKVVGASLCATDGQANPRLVGPAFARTARAAGVDIRELTEVTGASFDGETFETRAAGDLVVHSRFLVNTAGAWGGKVASWFGEAAPVEPLCPNMLVSEPIEPLVARSVGVCGGDVYVRQALRGNIVFGGGRGWGDIEVSRTRPATESSALSMQKLLDIVPALRGVMVIRSWSGIDGGMPDHIPVVGPSAAIPRLIHAFGFSGHGFMLGPAIGEIIAELVDDGETPTPLDAFAITRFSTSKYDNRTEEAKTL
jgi:sarcosine oxidase subunit beta